jgi:t-SNARE complex subunit (syntaxin)
MSFQDFSGRPRPKAAAAAAPTSAGSSATTSSTGSTGGQKGPLQAISETLLQYQRNVGILERIVQPMATERRPEQWQELKMQYGAQADVIEQLEARVKQQFKQMEGRQSISATALQKLQRDFERVQNRAKALQDGAKKLMANRPPPPGSGHNAYSSAAALGQFEAAEDGEPQSSLFVQQQQRQMEEDRWAEQVMREREAEIRNVHRGMHQVKEIFQDLAHLTNEQQEQIDTVETQMEDARANAEAGLHQVEKANEKFGSSQCRIM